MSLGHWPYDRFGHIRKPVLLCRISQSRSPNKNTGSITEQAGLVFIKTLGDSDPLKTDKIKNIIAQPTFLSHLILHINKNNNHKCHSFSKPLTQYLFSVNAFFHSFFCMLKWKKRKKRRIICKLIIIIERFFQDCFFQFQL